MQAPATGKRVIESAWMWAKRNVRCSICGQFFADGDEYYLSVGQPKNALTHVACYEQHAGERNDDAMRIWMHERKTPTARNPYREDAVRTRIVVDELQQMFGLRVQYGPRVVQFRRRNRTVLSYNRKFGCLRIHEYPKTILESILQQGVRAKIATRLQSLGIDARFDA